MIFAAPTLKEILYVCRNMRELSRDEAFLQRSNDDPDELAMGLYRALGLKWVVYHERTPAALLGAVEKHPGVWQLFGLGTDDYAKVMVAVTKWSRRVMMPAVKATGAHRAQAISPTGHTETHKWLKFLGAHQEAVLKRYGKGGEDMLLFAWLKDDA